MEQSSTISNYRWVVMSILTSAQGINFSAVMLLGLFLPEISDEMDLSPSQQGWLGSSSIIVALVLSIPANNFVSRFKPKRVTALSFLAAAGFIYVQAWAPNFAILVLGRIGIGLASMVVRAPRAMLIQQWSVRGRQGVTNGVLFFGTDMIMGISFFIVPFILKWTGNWRDTTYIWGTVSLVFALAWIAFGRERVTSIYRDEMAAQTESPLRSILKYKELWIIGVGMGGGVMVEVAFSVFWPTFAQDTLAVPAVVTGMMFGVAFFAAAPFELGAMVVPFLVDRKYWVVIVSALVAFGTHASLLYVSSTPGVLGLAIAKGAALSYWPVMETIVFQLPGIKPREIAAGLALIETMILLGDVIGPLLVGFLQEGTGDLRFALLVTTFAPLVLVSSAILLWAGGGKGKPGTETAQTVRQPLSGGGGAPVPLPGQKHRTSGQSDSS